MKTIVLDKEIYSFECVRITQKIKQLPLKIKNLKGKIQISWDENEINNSQIGEFINELLNQQCRLDIFKENAEINRLIVSKILYSAIKSEKR